MTGQNIRPVNRPDYERDLASAKEALSTKRFVWVWEEGRGMTVDQAITCALNVPVDSRPWLADSG